MGNAPARFIAYDIYGISWEQWTVEILKTILVYYCLCNIKETTAFYQGDTTQTKLLSLFTSKGLDKAIVIRQQTH